MRLFTVRIGGSGDIPMRTAFCMRASFSWSIVAVGGRSQRQCEALSRSVEKEKMDRVCCLTHCEKVIDSRCMCRKCGAPIPVLVFEPQCAKPMSGRIGKALVLVSPNVTWHPLDFSNTPSSRTRTRCTFQHRIQFDIACLADRD